MYLAYSDKPIYDFLYKNNGKKIRLEEICAYTGIPHMTVRRAIQRLINAGKIRRLGGGRGKAKGFVYHVV